MKLKEVLSPCEFEVFERMVLGESVKEIAEHTYRSALTVQTTIRNAYAKLGINKATEAVLVYCGQTFDITEQIVERRVAVLKSHAREIMSVVLVCFFFGGQIFSFTDDPYRIRRRARRRYQVEVISITSNISL